MTLSIPELRQGDRVTITDLSTDSQREVEVQTVSSGRLDYDNQPFFIDTAGGIHWRDRVVINHVDRVQSVTKEEFSWTGGITTRTDGSKKTLKEILTERPDGKTSKDEFGSIMLGTQNIFRGLLSSVKKGVSWVGSQYPKADTVDTRNDYRLPVLIGYKPAGINEVEKSRYLRTGSVLKTVDNKNGSKPRRFGDRYITIFGAWIIFIGALLIAGLITSFI